MGKSPENSTEIGRKPSGKISSITLSLLALAQGIEIPTEEEFLELADDLEKNPPADLTPEGLAMIFKLIRGEPLVEGNDASKPIPFPKL
jgi:hypothetical protein